MEQDGDALRTLPVLYLVYMAVMVAVGDIGEIIGSKGMTHIAAVMGVWFLTALGMVISSGVAFAFGWMCWQAVASVGRAVGRWFEPSHPVPHELPDGCLSDLALYGAAMSKLTFDPITGEARRERIPPEEFWVRPFEKGDTRIRLSSPEKKAPDHDS